MNRSPIGDAFIKLVKMIIAPVIFLTVVTGIAGMRELGSVGRVAGKAFFYFITVSTFALIVGLIVANVVQPGAGMNIDPSTLKVGSIAEYTAKAHDTTVTGFLLGIIPDTLISAFTQGNILQVLMVAILFGISMALVGDPARPLLNSLERISVVVFRMVGILMRAAPIGAFGAIAFTIGKYGVGSLVNLGALVATFYLTSILFVVVVLGTIARANGFSVLKLIRYLKAELLLVLGTSSSEAALPNLLVKMEKAGCEKSVVGLVVPTGYSFNLDGTNIYMTLAALFIAQACGVDLAGPAASPPPRRDALVQGRGRRHRRGLHHPRRHPLDRAGRAGRGHGADPRCRPLHVGMPQPDQLHRQRRRHRRGRTLGRSARQGGAGRRAERQAGPDCARHHRSARHRLIRIPT